MQLAVIHVPVLPRTPGWLRKSGSGLRARGGVRQQRPLNPSDPHVPQMSRVWVRHQPGGHPYHLAKLRAISCGAAARARGALWACLRLACLHPGKGGSVQARQAKRRAPQAAMHPAQLELPLQAVLVLGLWRRQGALRQGWMMVGLMCQRM